MSTLNAGSLLWQMTADDRQLTQATERGKSLLEGLGGVAIKIGGVIAGVFAIKKGLDIFEGFVADAAEAETAGVRLEAVLRANGHAAGFAAAQLREYAGQLQQTTQFEDDQITASMAGLAKYRNVRGEIFTGATAAALDLASATGNDLAGSMDTLGRALNDPIRGMMMLKREGVSFTDQQQEQVKALIEANDVMGAQKIILDQLNNTFGGATAAIAETAEGSWARVTNQLGDMGETLGGIVLPYIKQAINWVEGHLPTIGGLIQWVADTATSFLSEWIPWTLQKTEEIIDAAIDTGSTIIGIFKNIGGMWQYVQLSIEIGILKVFDLFGEKGKMALSMWNDLVGQFADGMVSLFADDEEMTKRAQKAADAASALRKEALAEEKAGNTERAAEIRKREQQVLAIAEAEKPGAARLAAAMMVKQMTHETQTKINDGSLIKDLENQRSQLGDKIGEKLSDDIKASGDAAKKAVHDFMHPDAPDLTMPDAPKPSMPVTGPTKDDVKDQDDKEKKDKPKKKEKEGPKASISGLVESLSSFQTKILQDSNKKMEAIATDQLAEQKSQTTTLKEIAQSVKGGNPQNSAAVAG